MTPSRADADGVSRALVVVTVALLLVVAPVAPALADADGAPPSPPHELYGSVTMATGEPVSGATVAVTAAGETLRTTTTGDDGDYQLSVPDPNPSATDETVTVSVRGQSETLTYESGAADRVAFTVERSLTVSDLSVDTLVAVGESVPVTATVSNGGAVEATRELAFTVGSSTVATRSVTVAPGASETLEFSHTFGTPGEIAVSVGDAESTVSAVETTDGSPLTVSTEALEYGEVPVSERPTETVTVRNDGVDPVSVVTALDGPESAQFQVTEAPTDSLAPGESATVTVAFEPDGGQATATLRLSGAGVERTVSLSGTGVAPALTVDTALPVDVGTVAQGETATGTVTLSNSGSAPLAAQVSVASDAFSVASGSTVSLAPGESTTVEVVFDSGPDASGRQSATLTVTPAAATVSERQVPLVATVEEPSIRLSPDSLAFGDVTVGESATGAVVVSNDGTDTLTLDASVGGTGAFDVPASATPFTLDPGDSRRLQVTVTPETAGSLSGTLTVRTSDGAVEQSVELTANGQRPAFELAAADPVSFGDTPVGSTVTKTVTVTSTGTAPLTVDLTEAFTAESPFSLVGSERTLRLEPGESADITVGYAPTETGSDTGTLQFSTNVPDAADREQIEFTGTAVETDVSISPGRLTFGTVAVGDEATASVTVSNEGQNPITLDAPSASGSAFEVGTLPQTTLSPGESVSVSVSFAPTESATRTGSLSVVATAGGESTTLSSALVGTGAAASLAVEQNAVRAGVVPVDGGSTSVTVPVENAGPVGTSLTVTAAAITGPGAEQFTVTTGMPVSVAGGERTPVTVAFDPSVRGSTTATLELTATTADGTTTRTVSLLGTGSAPSPAAPTSVSVGTVAVGETVSRTLTVSNDGGAPFTVESITPAGSDADALAVTRDGPETVVPGDETAITLDVSPSTGGSIDAGVRVVTADADVANPTIDVAGIAAAPAASVETNELSFGTVPVGSATRKRVVVENTGSAPLTVAPPSIQGGNGAFEVLSERGRLRIAAGATETVVVGFAPTGTGATSASLRLRPLNDPGAEAIDIPLSGTGTDAQASFDQPAVAFGDVPYGETRTRTLTLRNDGGAPLSVTDVAVRGADADAFTLDGLSGDTSVAPGGTVSFTVSVAPPARQSVSASVRVETGDGVVTSSLGATGVAPDARVPDGGLGTGAFGTTRLGATSTARLPVHNDGNAPLAVESVAVSGADADAFTVVDAPDGTIAPKGSGTVAVEFDPDELRDAVERATGTSLTAAATLTVEHNASGSPTAVNLRGEAVTPAFTLSTKTLRFGTTPLGQRTTRQITLRNDVTGTAPITVTEPTVLGPDSGAYGVENGPTWPTTLAPGESTTVDVSLTPTTRGRKFGTLGVGTTDPRQSAKKVGLSNAQTVVRVDFGSANVTYIQPSTGQQPTANVNRGLRGRNVSLRAASARATTTETFSLNLSTAPTVEQPIDGSLPLRYVEATTTGSNVVSRSTLTLTVSKAALSAAGAAPEDVTVYRSDGGDYSTSGVSTELRYETRAGYVYDVTTDGFSVFAVAVPDPSDDGENDGSTPPAESPPGGIGGDAPDDDSDGSDSDDGDDSGGGGFVGDDASTPPVSLPMSKSLRDGAATIDLPDGEGTVRSVSVTGLTVDGTVRVDTVGSLPDGVPEPSGRTLSVVNVSAPDPTNGTATVAVSVPAAAVDTNAESLVVSHYTTAGWRTLDTTYTRTNDSIRFSARTSGFSLFALTDTGKREPTTSETSQPTTETTQTPTESSATPTTDGTTDAATTTSGGVSGFGAALALVALAAATLLAVRRD